MAWTFDLADRFGYSAGQLVARDRWCGVGVSAPSLARCKVSSADPLWREVAPLERTLKVYDDDERLVLWGPIVSDEETGRAGGADLVVQASDVSWRLAKRIVGKKAAASDQDLRFNQDVGLTVFDILALANAAEATGIVAGTRDPFAAKQLSYVWKRASEVLVELAAGTFEWGLRYQETAGVPTAFLDLAGQRGILREDTFFEYGTGKANTGRYVRRRDGAAAASDYWALGQGTTTWVAAADTGARGRLGLLEEKDEFSGIGVQSLLAVLAAAHIAVRNRARLVVELDPFPLRSPAYGEEWDVGDIVQAYVEVAGDARVNGLVRIWSAEFNIDDEGVATPRLHLIGDTSS